MRHFSRLHLMVATTALMDRIKLIDQILQTDIQSLDSGEIKATEKISGEYPRGMRVADVTYSLNDEKEVIKKCLEVISKKHPVDYSFYRPPGRDKRLDAQFVELLEGALKAGVGEQELIIGILKEYK